MRRCRCSHDDHRAGAAMLLTLKNSDTGDEQC
jgi:hypothetical protein